MLFDHDQELVAFFRSKNRDPSVKFEWKVKGWMDLKQTQGFLNYTEFPLFLK